MSDLEVGQSRTESQLLHITSAWTEENRALSDRADAESAGEGARNRLTCRTGDLRGEPRGMERSRGAPEGRRCRTGGSTARPEPLG